MNYKILPIIFTLLFLSGCMQIQLESGGNKDDVSKNGSSNAFLDSYFWGSYYDIWWSEKPENLLKEQLKDHQTGKVRLSGLYRVVYTTDYFSSFISTFSFGFFVPFKVTWWLENDINDMQQTPTVQVKR